MAPRAPAQHRRIHRGPRPARHGAEATDRAGRGNPGRPGDAGSDGLVQLVKRKAAANELAATRGALDDKLAEAETRIGEGLGSRTAVVVNSSIIVFREGLEAVRLSLLPASISGELVTIDAEITGALPGGAGTTLLSRRERIVASKRATSSLSATAGTPPAGYRFQVTPEF